VAIKSDDKAPIQYHINTELQAQAVLIKICAAISGAYFDARARLSVWLRLWGNGLILKRLEELESKRQGGSVKKQKTF
jgi:hypothetical protein